MKTTLKTTLVVFSLYFATTCAQSSTFTPQYPQTYQGCFSSASSLKDQGSATFQTSGYCGTLCGPQSQAVMATTKGSDCWCGSEIPPESDKVPDSECNTPCDGFPQKNCGGMNSFSVYLTGTTLNAEQADSDSDSSSSSPSSTGGAAQSNATPPPSSTVNGSPSVITRASTVLVTAPGQTSPGAVVTTQSSQPSSGGPNKGAIAAGAVVGVLVVCALIGGLFFFLRQRRRRAIESEYQRNASINGFMAGGKPQSTHSTSDSRLEPSVMMQRRPSDGSIADHQDYSRRILKVTNPDGS
ncbi:hypothetical protein MMC20_007070 [Loxospora ochrophaea]|nr:hypothetical protein [Loxospora ochrophaea]